MWIASAPCRCPLKRCHTATRSRSSDGSVAGGGGRTPHCNAIRCSSCALAGPTSPRLTGASSSAARSASTKPVARSASKQICVTIRGCCPARRRAAVLPLRCTIPSPVLTVAPIPSGCPHSPTVSTPRRASAPLSSRSSVVANGPPEGRGEAGFPCAAVSCAPSSPRTTSTSESWLEQASCHESSLRSSSASLGTRDAAMCGTGSTCGAEACK
mmetsp:Transcript_47312/g.152466  ORF Transcript_47312/g.152466 Transcript_47312/m.152466 type:complete len:213 (-) Transcript_47312:193-831(-)